MVDINEDPEESFFQDGSPTNRFYSKNCAGMLQLHRSKLIHQNNVTRNHVLLAKMQDANKGIVAKDLETKNGAPV